MQNATIGTSVLKVMATDPDNGAGGSFEFSLKV